MVDDLLGRGLIGVFVQMTESDFFAGPRNRLNRRD